MKSPDKQLNYFNPDLVKIQQEKTKSGVHTFISYLMIKVNSFNEFNSHHFINLTELQMFKCTNMIHGGGGAKSIEVGV